MRNKILMLTVLTTLTTAHTAKADINLYGQIDLSNNQSENRGLVPDKYTDTVLQDSSTIGLIGTQQFGNTNMLGQIHLGKHEYTNNNEVILDNLILSTTDLLKGNQILTIGYGYFKPVSTKYSNSISAINIYSKEFTKANLFERVQGNIVNYIGDNLQLNVYMQTNETLGYFSKNPEYKNLSYYDQNSLVKQDTFLTSGGGTEKYYIKDTIGLNGVYRITDNNIVDFSINNGKIDNYETNQMVLGYSHNIQDYNFFGEYMVRNTSHKEISSINALQITGTKYFGDKAVYFKAYKIDSNDNNKEVNVEQLGYGVGGLWNKGNYVLKAEYTLNKVGANNNSIEFASSKGNILNNEEFGKFELSASFTY